MSALCDVCGGPFRPYRHAWLRRCAACGVLSADLPSAIPCEASDSGVDEQVREAGLGATRRRNNETLLSVIAELGAAGRLLDVGCGPGLLLAQAGGRGVSAVGVEPDPNALAVALSRGLDVRRGYFPEALAPGERFGVIVFNDVLEHIPDLAGALAAAADRLSLGGLLVLNCPDQRGLFFRAASLLDRLGVHGPYNRLWQRGLPSPHVWYFTPGMLERAAARHGFALERSVRLVTVDLRGLWARIRTDRSTSLPVALASVAFAWVTWPVSRLLPSDATACVFRRVN
jgi:SAM-dependent methyltransferase